MERWYTKQRRLPAQPDYAFRAPIYPVRFRDLPEPPSAFEARLQEAAEELRQLYEAGEIEWADLNARAAYEMAFLDD